MTLCCITPLQHEPIPLRHLALFGGCGTQTTLIIGDNPH